MPKPVVPQVVIKQKGVEQTEKLLAGLAKRGADPRPAFRSIMDEMRLAEDPWFRSHGQGAWPDLADVTRQTKERLGFPADPLVRTGLMGASLTLRSGRGTIRTVNKEGFRFGTRVFYANFHRYGSGNTPERNPLIPIDEHTRTRMVYDVKHYLLTGNVAGNVTYR